MADMDSRIAPRLASTACKAPSSFVRLSSEHVSPGETVNLSWSGADSGTNNYIQRYYIEHSTNGKYWVAPPGDCYIYTSLTNGKQSVKLQNSEGVTYSFRIRTEGSAGSQYYSEWKYLNNACTTYSKPAISNLKVSQNLGNFTISWEGKSGLNNPIKEYEIWVSDRSSTSDSWWAGGITKRVSGNTTSTTYTGGTVGKYYRFKVVAVGTWYSRADSGWSSGYIKDPSYTSCGAPSNLKSNITNPTIGQTITLSWNAGTSGSNNSVTGYELYYSLNKGNTYNLISSSISSSARSYSYTVPKTPGEIRFRIRTKGSAGSNYYSGYNYSSNYQTITIQKANPPSAGNIYADLVDSGASKVFEITWSGFSGNTYNPIGGYSLYYQTSKTIDDSDFGKLILITDSLSSSRNNYTWTGGIWGNYYKFAIKAKGQYDGESQYVYTTAILKKAEESSAPTGFTYSGEGYHYDSDNDESYVIPGLKIKVAPTGGKNVHHYILQYRETKNETTSSWKTITSNFPAGYDANISIIVSSDLDDGDYINFRAAAVNAAGDQSDYFPETDDLEYYKINVKDFREQNLLHPIIQIKRASTSVWERENNESDGIRVYDGELVYDTEKRILKIGNSTTGTPQKFNELQSLFGLLDVGGGNKVTASNSVAIGNSNYMANQMGYGIIECDYNAKTLTLTSVKGLEVNNPVKISSSNTIHDDIIISIDTNTNTVTLQNGVNVNINSDYIFNIANQALWVENENNYGIPTLGDQILYSPSSNLVVGESNIGSGRGNLIVGSRNIVLIPEPFNLNYIGMYSTMIGSSNKMGVSNNSLIVGNSNKTYYSSESLITGQSNTANYVSNSLIAGNRNQIINTGYREGSFVGRGLKNNPSYSVPLTVGQYNDPSQFTSSSVFCIGSGSSDSNRKNSIIVTTSLINFYYSSYIRDGKYLYFYNNNNNSCGYISGTSTDSINTMRFYSSLFYMQGKLKNSLSITISNSTDTGTMDTNMNFNVGPFNTVTGQTSASIGQRNTTNDGWEYIIGYQNNATHQLQTLIGYDLTGYVTSNRQVVVGYRNRATTGDFIVGGGTSGTQQNAFRTSGTTCYSYSGINSSGADYAEYFEWEDGNVNDEDRAGYFVTHSDEKIKIAKEGDFIIGIVSAAPAVIGNNPEEWNYRFKKDIYGRIIHEKKLISDEYIETFDGEEKNKKIIVPEHYEYIPVLNPEYDETQLYVERDKRKEWACIGLMGKLVANDDGTCVAGGFCKCNSNGIATNSLEQTKYRVLKRLDNSHIKILIL